MQCDAHGQGYMAVRKQRTLLDAPSRRPAARGYRRDSYARGSNSGRTALGHMPWHICLHAAAWQGGAEQLEGARAAWRGRGRVKQRSGQNLGAPRRALFRRRRDACGETDETDAFRADTFLVLGSARSTLHARMIY